MILKTKNINVFLSTLNLVLCVVGYQLVTTVFLPKNVDLEGISQAVTIPYRAFALGLMLLVFLINIRKKITPLPFPQLILILYWFLIILRIVYDIYVSGTASTIKNTQQLWLFVFGICLTGLLSTIKSFHQIDFNKAINWIIFSIAIILVTTLFSNQALIGNTENDLRVDANAALNTISYGNLGVTAIYLSLYKLFESKKSYLFKILLILLIALSVYSILRAGSRGPLLALLVVLLFWFFSKGRNMVLGISVVIFSLVLIYIFREQVISLMGEVSPIIENRLRTTFEGTNEDGRKEIRELAIQGFYDNPFVGSHFALIKDDGTYVYAHNLILDALMGLGLFGGILMAYLIMSALRITYRIFKQKKVYSWIAFLTIHQLVVLMLSGTFYEDQLFTVLLTLNFMLYKFENTT